MSHHCRQWQPTAIVRLQRQPMTRHQVGERPALGTCVCGPVSTAGRIQSDQRGQRLLRRDRMSSDLSTFEDATERGIPQRPSCWQEVVRDSVVLDQRATDSELRPSTRPGYEAIADVVLLTDSDAENLSGLFCARGHSQHDPQLQKSMAELRHLGHYSETSRHFLPSPSMSLRTWLSALSSAGTSRPRCESPPLRSLTYTATAASGTRAATRTSRERSGGRLEWPASLRSRRRASQRMRSTQSQPAPAGSDSERTADERAHRPPRGEEASTSLS